MEEKKVIDITPPQMPQIPKWVSGWLTPAVFILFIIGFFYTQAMVYIRPNECGIKQINIGITKGIQKKIYTAGYHFVIPFGFQKIYRFPRDMQVVFLTDNERSMGRIPGIRVEKAATIQTSDGFFVLVDVSILYRIIDPYLVLTTVGPGRLFEDNGIIPKAEPALKETLGELTTEEFYNSPLRSSKAIKTKELLNKALLDKGIKVEQVLVRYFKYSDEIQRNIEDKKLKDQLVFKNIAEGKAALEEAKLKKTIQEGIATVNIKLEEAEAYRVRKQAEIELYKRRKKAEADLLVKLAEAERTDLKNSALRGAGSDEMVGLKMAEVLEGLDTIILSSGEGGLNPLNLKKMLRLFGVKGGK